ncbi:hypothetical protein OC835_006225 [Tilletia horrida]|nr:hypothetical protein OC835_006225 [Tilletia horrida]
MPWMSVRSEPKNTTERTTTSVRTGGNPQRDQTVQELIDGTCSSVSTLMTKTGTFNLMLVAFHYKHNCDDSLRAVQTLGWLRPEEVDRAQLRLRIDPTSAVLHLGRARGDEAATQWVQLDTDPSLLNATICILLLAVISSTSAYQGEKMLPKSSFNKLHNDVKSDPDKRLVRMRLWSHIHKVPSPLKEITNDARVMQILKLMQRVYTAQLQGPSNSKEQCQIWLGMGAVSGSITLTAEVQGQLRGWTSQTETEGQVQPQQVFLRYDHIRRELLGRGPSGDAHKIPLEWNSTSESGRRVLYAIGTSFLGTPGPAL